MTEYVLPDDERSLNEEQKNVKIYNINDPEFPQAKSWCLLWTYNGPELKDILMDWKRHHNEETRHRSAIT